VEWSYDPWRERPRRAAGALGAAAVVIAAVVLSGLPGLATLALGVVAVAWVARDLVPVRCRVGEAGLARLGPLGAEVIPWERLRRVRARTDAVVGSTALRSGPLEPWRTLFLPLPSLDRAGLLEAIRPILSRHGF
jgi:hypothetical protein